MLMNKNSGEGWGSGTGWGGVGVVYTLGVSSKWLIFIERVRPIRQSRTNNDLFILIFNIL